MVQTVESLELPRETYLALEQIAQFQGITPRKVIESWIQQHQSKEKLSALRQEYQRLIDKELMETLTPKEEKRLEIVCDKINAIEMDSQAMQQGQRRLEEVEERLDEIGEHFRELRNTLESLPDRSPMERR